MLLDKVLNDKYEITGLMKVLDFVNIYNGKDLKTGALVIIKELTNLFSNPVLKQQALEHFKIEAKSYFKISHPNLPKYKDYFDFAGKRYLVLEYIEGKSLKHVLEECNGYLEPQKVIAWSIKICDLLSYLHTLKPFPIIFKNLNPDNIFLMPDGEINLFDFGTTKTAGNLPKSYEAANTCFSSPEQYGGEVDNRTDIYSLGATMYYLLTGNSPPDALDLDEENEDSIQIRNFNKELSPELESVVINAMAYLKEDRYQVAEEMKRELTYIASLRGVSANKTPIKTVQPSLATFSKREEVLEKYPELKFLKSKKEKDDKFRKNVVFQKLTSGVKVIRDKRSITSEKFDSVTDRLENEIDFDEIYPEKSKDLKSFRSEMKYDKKIKTSTSHLEKGNTSLAGSESFLDSDDATEPYSEELPVSVNTTQPVREKKRFPGLTGNALPPDTILKEHYKILDLVNISPLSVTYKGWDILTQNYVMVKELIDAFTDLSAREQALRQFKIEAKILFKIIHPNLPRYQDYFDYDYKRYLVMEYIKGKNLNVIVNESPDFIDELQVIEWGLQLCDVLYYIHNIKPEPIIFRNLKPENIILSDEGIIKLVDFGISKFFEKTRKTLDVAKVINHHFSPFEQYNGQTDERTDIYSLGAILYFILTRTKPADALDISMGVKILESCKRYNPNISTEMDSVIRKAMREEKEQRYQHIEEFSEAMKLIYYKNRS